MRRTLATAALALALGSASARADDPDLLVKADRIARDVSRLRGLRIKRPIKRGVMTRDQIRARVLAIIRAEYTPAWLAGTDLLMKRLGMLTPDQDYLGTYLDFATDQLRGFYDHTAQELYLAEWASDDVTLAHEINHALQDQHFALKEWIEIEKTNSDAGMARRALGEGDATALMIEYDMRGSTPASPWADEEAVTNMLTAMRGGLTALDRFPLALREASAFMYVNGLKFVAGARKTKSWREIDAMYARPPLSTEHVIHPEKYAAYEPPIEVTAARPRTLDGWKTAHADVSGEFGLWALLTQYQAAADSARQAVEGWGGDRVVVYSPPGYDGVLETAVLVSYSVWDTEADAHAFAGVVAGALPQLAGGEAITGLTGIVAYRTRERAIAWVERRGDAVVVVVGAPPARADELRAQVWETWTVGRR